ncbi:MAG: glycosyltransferase family 61 protein [Pseudomonadota bacterium]|nr:glycosyltransferase family 61 protein [Pseudomonadota bacterium]
MSGREVTAIDWPEIVELNNIIISPLLAGSSKGYTALYADPPSPLLRHYRYGHSDSSLQVLPFPGPDAGVKQVVEEPVIYGGLMFRHFGHSLTEGIHRLWPRFALKELHTAKVAFNVVNNSKIMPYVSEALNLHGISRSGVIPIQEPTLFRRLFVGPQARQMAGPTLIPGYQTMLDRYHARRLPTPDGQRRLYVSRLHHHHTGSFFGESFVEAQLAAQGFEIVYPEQITLTQLVILLRDSEIAVFAEGSAIHALELCGSAVPAVFVIGRRQHSLERFAPLLENICSRWQVAEHWLASAGMAPDFKKHSSVLDMPALMKDLWSFAGLGGSCFDNQVAVAAIRHDLAIHIADERNVRTDDYGARALEVERAVEAAADAASRR